MRVFLWAEFQKRGALHYHGILVDSPFSDVASARRWFTAHWRAVNGDELAGIQAWVEYRSAAWFRKAGGDYILKDVRKLNGKRYEQDYERMPARWRTFTSNQLTFAAAEHQEHETKAQTVCVAPIDAPWHVKAASVYVFRVDWHIPGTGGCRLFNRRSRKTRRPPVVARL